MHLVYSEENKSKTISNVQKLFTRIKMFVFLDSVKVKDSGRFVQERDDRMQEESRRLRISHFEEFSIIF